MKHTSKIWRLVAAIGVTAILAACSDGEYKLAPASNITPEPPDIVKFEANPILVERGGSTTLSWEVVNADTVEIGSAPESLINFHIGPLAELTSQTLVSDITETTEFILTASNTVLVASPSNEGNDVTAITVHKAGQIPIPEPAGSPSENPPEPETFTATKSVTVEVGGSSGIEITSFTADDTTIDGCGQSTQICWSVTPQSATVTVTANGETIVESGNATDCATVTPMETTTYTLVATANGASNEQTLTITVAGGNPNIRSFKVNGRPDATVQSFDDPVEVTWEVEPESAKVTITASPEAEGCELPTDSEMVNGTASCTIAADTTFTISVTACGETETDEASVTRQSGQIADAACVATPWAFEGEKVTVKADPDAIPDNDRSAIAKVYIGGKDYDMPAEGPLVMNDVLVPAGGVNMVVESVSGIKITHTKCVEAVHPSALSISENNEEIYRILMDETNNSLAYIGVKNAGWNDGTVHAYKTDLKDRNVETAYPIDIGAPIRSAAQNSDFWAYGVGTGFFEMVKDYPVSALAVDGSRLFMGTTGVVMYTEDDGATWKMIGKDSSIPRFNTDDHKTCGGEMQPGNGQAVGSLGRVCDMIAKNNRLILATDLGVITYTDLNAFIQTPSADYVAGRPPEGPIDLTAYPTYGAVAHDLEATDSVIYVAAERGLFKSADEGSTWEKVSGIDEEVFSVAFDKMDNKIYAGAADSIKILDVSSAGSVSGLTKTIGKKVLSLVVDPFQKGVVVAGTEGGIYVTRDKGEAWTQVTSVGFAEDTIVRAVAISAKEVETDQIEYIISFGGQGFAVDRLVVNLNPEVSEPVGGDDDGSDDTGDDDDTIPGDGDGTVNPGLSFHSIYQYVASWFTS